MVQNHRAFLLSSNMFHPHLVADTLSAQYGIPSRRVYPQLCADAHDYSFYGGRLLWDASADAEGFRLCGHDQRTEPVWRLCDRPLETFARSLLQLCSDPTLAGRGGSVSRRDHSQAYRRRVQLSGGTNSAEAANSNASRFPGGGPGEGPFSERPPPPEYLSRHPFTEPPVMPST